MKIIHLKNTPIFEQLQLEEALLRLSNESYCLINEGSPPAIVMGISGKADELVDLNKLKTTSIPLIRRYSGGGTVVVDEDTLFVSFLCQKELHDFAPYPEPIMRWSASLYKEVLQTPSFNLRENDYVLDERKIGGNAQYLRKDRWMHHTTFLWDYQPERMQLLLHPKKTPAYRKARPHEAFITRLKEHFPSKELFIERLKNTVRTQFAAEDCAAASLLPFLKKPHRKSTELCLLEKLLSRIEKSGIS